jgi:RNA polymerase sigma factor (sigma-70 family)
VSPLVFRDLTDVCHGEYMTTTPRYSGRIMTAIASTVPRPVTEALIPLDPRLLDVAHFLRVEYPRVVASVRAVAGDHDAAVDAVHESLVQLLTDSQRDWPRNVAAWLTVVASNRARDVRRREAVGRRVVDRLRPAPPEDPVDRVGRDLDVLAALDTLPPRMREVCVRHYLEDRSVRDIAIELGISTGTVKTQLHRARLALAKLLVT